MDRFEETYAQGSTDWGISVDSETGRRVFAVRHRHEWFFGIVTERIPIEDLNDGLAKFLTIKLHELISREDWS